MSNFLTKILALIHSPVGHYIVSFGEQELKVAATSPLGVAILNAIHAGEAGTSAPQKIGLAIESLTPTIASYVAGGGFTALADDIETVARVAIEGVLSQLKATGPLAIIERLEELALHKAA